MDPMVSATAFGLLRPRMTTREVDGQRQRISISIPKRDLAKLKTRAAEEGMPYQTLINSILHKYVEKG